MRCAALAALAVLGVARAADEPPTMVSVLAASTSADWQTLDQARLLYLYLDSGVIVFELNEEIAPRHVANIEVLARQRYWDGLAIVRSQDNYVVQWGDPAAGGAQAKSLGDAAASLPPEFFRARAEVPFTVLQTRDSYADEVGFVGGFPAARDGSQVWLSHCYGMLGVGRGNAADSGNGAQLYVVIGHAPRHLDRNVTLVGRAVYGIERLSALPRGSGPLGFYADEGEYVPIRRIRLGSELEAEDRLPLERLRTDTATFAHLVDARRYRREDWFLDPTGHIGLCNVPLPVRLGE